MNRREEEKRERRKSDAKAWAGQQGKGFESTCIKLPDGIEFYKLEVGTHLVDFMSFIAGKGNPRADEGMEHFERTYEGHRIPIPGSNNSQMFACRYKCFGQRCFVCDWIRDFGRSADPILVKGLRPKTRHLWLVNDKPGDVKNPLKVFDSNHFANGMGFGEMMADAITSVPEYADFSDPEKGMTLQLTVKEQSLPGFKYKAVTRIDFRPRNYTYPLNVIEKAPCLDDCIMLISNEALQQAMEGGKDDDVEMPSVTQPNKSDQTETVQFKDDVDEGVAIKVGSFVSYKGMKCEILAIGKDGKLVLEDPSGKPIKVMPGELDNQNGKPAGKTSSAKPASAPALADDDDDMDDEPPARPTVAKATAKATVKDDDDDDDMDDDDLDDD